MNHTDHTKYHETNEPYRLPLHRQSLTPFFFGHSSTSIHTNFDMHFSLHSYHTVDDAFFMEDCLHIPCGKYKKFTHPTILRNSIGTYLTTATHKPLAPSRKIKATKLPTKNIRQAFAISFVSTSLKLSPIHSFL